MARADLMRKKELKMIHNRKFPILLIQPWVFLLFIFFHPAFAETVILKTGQKLEGKITEKNDKYIKLDVYGVEMPYFLEDIASIEGEVSAAKETPSAVRPAQDKEKSPAEIFKTVSPAVVIFTRQFPEGEKNIGSGFVVDEKGVIVTCFHVMSNPSLLKVKLKDGREFEMAGVIAYDQERDICILRISAQDLPVLPLGDAGSKEPGDKVLAIGAPLGLEYTISDGLLSGKRELFGKEYLQFTAPSSPGNSGGPLIDSKGNAIGIIASQFTEGQNLNFAIPIDDKIRTLITQKLSTASDEEATGKLGIFTQGGKYIEKGLEYSRAGDFKLALENFQKATELGFETLELYEAMSSVYGSMGEFEKEIQYAKKALAINPNSELAIDLLSVAYETKILLLLKAKKDTEATTWFTKYITDLEEISRYYPDKITLIRQGEFFKKFKQ